VRLLCAETDWRIVNFDKLTYAGNLENVADLPKERTRFVQGDICDQMLVGKILAEEKPWAVVNFAAESHVDRSILDASPFLQTNIGGVRSLLEAVRAHSVERFLHVSTDEVYGDKEGKEPSTEESPLLPSSPYAATKAAADLLCFSYRRTHGVPVIVTRSSNNYGPYQFPEKLIPLMITRALADQPLPVYGDGLNVRDWLHVEDHAAGLITLIERGRPGERYNFGGDSERTNLAVVEHICATLDRLIPTGRPRRKLISFVTDRPGHDQRYAIDASKARGELGWKPRRHFEAGLEQTVHWYLDNRAWWEPLHTRVYGGERLGLLEPAH
jgi:dTDP-glucose 4,6-dehydratase